MENMITTRPAHAAGMTEAEYLTACGLSAAGRLVDAAGRLQRAAIDTGNGDPELTAAVRALGAVVGALARTYPRVSPELAAELGRLVAATDGS